MDDGLVHHHILSSFVQRGHSASVDELAAALAAAPHEIEASLRRLHEGHGLVLHPGSLEVWVAHPFSASPSAVWVSAGARGWWAPCLWCAAGIVALCAPSATLYTRYAGEHEPLQLELRDGVSLSADVPVHFALPPRGAWSNVIHWCATVLPFRSSQQVEAWSTRHRLPRGVIVPWSQVLALGRAWYERHLDPDWRKWTLSEAQAIFREVGLVDPFWQLPESDASF